MRRMILGGQLPPGSKIDQANLAEQLGISLVPLREALRKLEAEGLVRIVPHRGAFVTPISREELADLYSIREILEGLATGAACRRLADEELRKLRCLISEMEPETSNEDHTALLNLNRQFHLTIYNGSGRSLLCGLIASLWDKSERYRSLYVNVLGRSGQAHAEHKQILQALEERCAKEAVRAVRDNIRQTKIVLLASFDQGQGMQALTSPVMSDTERTDLLSALAVRG